MQTLVNIRSELETHLGDRVKITANGSRNRVKIYKGTLKEVYRSVFVVEIEQLKQGVNRVSYNHTDILLDNIEIEYI